MPDRGGFATLRLLFPYHGRIAERGRHGATYQPDTGLCVGGPCKNGRLTVLTVEERHGAVYWQPAGKIQPLAAA